VALRQLPPMPTYHVGQRQMRQDQAL
jgi:hypothetical protein